jgi:hypothetical protein
MTIPAAAAAAGRGRAMAETTYHLDRIADLLGIPSDRREECVRDLLVLLELAEFADGRSVGPFEWTDDGKKEFALSDPADKAAWLTLKVCEGEVTTNG